ncbi:MAG: hypothetical protein ACOCP8_01860 [archaeon]
MKFTTIGKYSIYFITLYINGRKSIGIEDKHIARKLNITINKFREEGKQYNGKIHYNNGELYFTNKKDANKFINNYLEPLAIINKISSR